LYAHLASNIVRPQQSREALIQLALLSRLSFRGPSVAREPGMMADSKSAKSALVKGGKRSELCTDLKMCPPRSEQWLTAFRSPSKSSLTASQLRQARIIDRQVPSQNEKASSRSRWSPGSTSSFYHQPYRCRRSHCDCHVCITRHAIEWPQ